MESISTANVQQQVADGLQYLSVDSHIAALVLCFGAASVLAVTLLGILLGLTLMVHEVSWYLSGGGVAKVGVGIGMLQHLHCRHQLSALLSPCTHKVSVQVMNTKSHI